MPCRANLYVQVTYFCADVYLQTFILFQHQGVQPWEGYVLYGDEMHACSVLHLLLGLMSVACFENECMVQVLCCYA